MLSGFAFTGYRSFFSETQFVGPLSKINFFIGANNSGKSNLLCFINDKLSEAFKNGEFATEGLDTPLEKSGTVQLLIGFDPKESSEYNSFLANNPLQKPLVQKILSSKTLYDDSGLVWIPFFGGSPLSNLCREICTELASVEHHEWWQLEYSLNSRQKMVNDEVQSYTLPAIFNGLLKLFRIPNWKVKLIPAFRKIGIGEFDFAEELAKLQNPDLKNYASDKKKFDQINDFLKKVVGNDSAKIEVSRESLDILVHLDNRSLPIDRLGTGIHQVLILAVEMTRFSKHAVCIEEPEMHLHPLLLKQLMLYLRDHTDNQYFISTHSSQILDINNCSVFHVRLCEEQHSTIERLTTDKKKAEVCHQLGYKPSDLMQANCIIWVEGPSDRIYLKYWISTLNQSLIEGLHYSIMIYGGKLLSHLYGQDIDPAETPILKSKLELAEDLISLRRLNRFASIVLDSDISSSTSSINSTKKRIVNEFDQGPGFAWVTAGREIENYFYSNTLEKAIHEVHGTDCVISNNAQRYKRPLESVRNGSKLIPDKVKIAKNVVKQKPELSRFDLKEKISALVHFIQTANGI